MCYNVIVIVVNLSLKSFHVLLVQQVLDYRGCRCFGPFKGIVFCPRQVVVVVVTTAAVANVCVDIVALSVTTATVTLVSIAPLVTLHMLIVSILELNGQRLHFALPTNATPSVVVMLVNGVSRSPPVFAMHDWWWW